MCAAANSEAKYHEQGELEIMMSATDDPPRDGENASAQEFTQSTNDSPGVVSSGGGGGGGGGGASANEYPNEYPPNPTNDEVAFDVHIGDDATVAHAYVFAFCTHLSKSQYSDTTLSALRFCVSMNVYVCVATL